MAVPVVIVELRSTFPWQALHNNDERVKHFQEEATAGKSAVQQQLFDMYVGEVCVRAVV